MDEKISKIKIKPSMIVGLIGLAIIIVLIIILKNLLRTNPYGEEIRIDNLSSVYTTMPQEQKDRIFNALYEVVSINMSDGSIIPESGAMIREGTATQEYDSKTNINTGNFIVDISSIKQSYQVEFEWSSDNNNKFLGGYTVSVTCLPRSLQIYESWSCKSLFGADPDWENYYQVEYTFGARTALIVTSVLSDFLIENNKDSGVYNILIDEASLRQEREQPDLTYSFDAMLNQEDSFSVVVRMDSFFGNNYVAIYVDEGEIEQGFIISDSDEYRDTLTGWLVNISADEQLQIETLTVDEALD